MYRSIRSLTELLELLERTRVPFAVHDASVGGADRGRLELIDSQDRL